MRKLAALVLLVGAAFLVWAGARWFAHRGERKVHIVFRDAGDLRRGDQVFEKGVVVGEIVRVEAVDDKTAVTVRIHRDHHRTIVSDSLFRIEERRLIVENTFAIGSPVEDGAIIQAREGRFSQWLAKNAGSVRPYIDRIRGGTDTLIDEKIETWSRKVPDWKREGSKVMERALEEAGREVEELETELRNAGKSDEARKVREKFKVWVESVKRK